ncbi:MAG: UDP-glucuronic acid decarboxylase family protein [candidate division FCPU426 bacterium]
MRILVAGGAGFIGSHLCDRLLALRHSVICLDNLKTGRTANLARARKSPRFRFVKGDVRQPRSLAVDCVFNLASYASPPYYQAWSIDTLMTNSLGSHQLLELARRQKAKYLFASTSEIYGDPLHHPQTESDWGNVNPVGVRSCYDEAKRFGEALTMEYVRKHRLDARIVRIFNTYGPRLQPDDGRVVSNFITQALAGKPLTIYGRGQQTRSFCYVDDLVEGLIRAAFRPRTAGAIINLGNPREFTVLEAARLVNRLTGRKLPLVFKPLPGDDPQRRRPDIRRAQKLLGWTPKVPLAEGLKKTIAWFQTKSREA